MLDIVRGNRREVVPIVPFDLGAPSEFIRYDPQWSAILIDDEVFVQTGSVGEKLVPDPKLMGNRHYGGLFFKAVHTNVHRIHQPHHLSAVHDELVDHELVLIAESAVGFGDHQSVHTV